LTDSPTFLVTVVKGSDMSLVGFVKEEKGQSVVEFALVFPIFALVFFAIVGFSHLFYGKLTLQHALHEAGRYMVTGRTESGLDRTAAIQSVFDQNLIGTGLSCPDIGPQFNFSYSGCAEADGFCDDAGGAGQTVKVTASFTKPWFMMLFDAFSEGGITLTVSTTWKNEPF